MRLGMGLGLGNLLSGQPLTGFPNDFSFNFDGSNDYLDLGTDLKSWVESPNKSFSVWIKNSGNTSESRVFNVGLNGSSTGFGFGLDGGSTDNKPFYFLRNASGTLALKAEFGDVLNTTDWYHFAISVDGTANEAYVYQNGELKATVSNVGAPSQGTVDTAKIGKQFNDSGNNYFNGLIDEFAIWDTTLSSDDVAKIASKPVDFSKASTYATDRTSNLKLWLRAGDKALPEEDASIARQDFYTDFDGTDDFVSFDSTDFPNLTPYTITAWFKADTIGTAGVVVWGDEAVYERRAMFTYNNKLTANIYGETPSGATTLVANTLYHGAVVVNPTAKTYKIYLDGQLDGSGSYTNDFVSWSGTTGYIGKTGSNEDFDGAIYSTAVYKTELDSTTISQMAKSRFTPMRDNRFSVVDFDGVNDYIALDSEILLTGEFTFNFWLSTTYTGSNYLVGHSTNTSMIRLNQSIARLRMNVGGTTLDYITSFSTPADGSWFNLTVTRDSSNVIRGYIDGVQSGTTVTNSDTFYFNEIGNFASNSEYEGSMSSLSVYNVEKSAEEIYAIYQQGITYDESSLSGLQGYWRMGDDTSKAYPTIADSSSNSNDGTITNGASDDIVQQMVAGYDLGAFESSSEELQLLVTDGGWTTGGSWVYDSSTGYYTNTYINSTDTPLGNIIASPATTVGRVYKLSYTVVSTTGSPTLKFPNNMLGLSNADIPYTVGETNVHYGVDGGSNENIGIRSNTGVGTIVLKDIKFEEVLQSEVSDTYPAIIDVNEPVLGVEEVSEPSFASSTGWTLGTGWSISSNTLSSDGSQSAVSNAIASITTGAGYYRVVITVDSISSGTIRPNLESWGSYISTTGTSTQFFTLTGNNNLTIQASADFVGSISFTSVKEVFGNVGKMTNQDSADLVYSSVLPDQSFLTGANSSYGFGSFDGTNDIVTANAVNTDYKSFSVWVKPTTTVTTSSGSEPIGSFLTGSLGVIWIGAFAGGDTNELITLYDGTRTTWENAGDASFPSDSWTHLGLVWDGSKYQIYYNGQPQTTITNAGGGHVPLQNNNSIFIGRGGTSRTEFFDGDIAGVALWNKSLSASEVSAIYSAGRHTNLLDSYSDNLITYLAFGNSDATSGVEDTSSTIYDRSGNSNHGTVSGTTLKSPPNAEPNGYAKGDTNRSTTTP